MSKESQPLFKEGSMASDKLTIQALQDHDKVQPKFKAVRGPGTSNSKDQKEGSKNSQVDDHVQRRSRKISTTSRESASGITPGTKTSGTGMSFFRLVAATKAWQRLAKNRRSQRSEQEQEKAKPLVRYENTYRTEPVEGKQFIPQKVECLLQEIMEAKLRNVNYDPHYCRSLSTDLSSVIKSRVKMLEFTRYKIVCNVIIMQNKEQGVEVASRCVWNQNTDSFATYTYRSSSLIAVAYVHAVYAE